MAIPLSSARRAHLDAILDGWRDWSIDLSGRPSVVEALSGWSNANFRVRAGKTELVVRLNDDTSHLGVDRVVERTALEDVATRHFAPPVVHVGPDHLVSRFVAGECPVTPSPTDAARLLTDIHTTPTRITSILDPWAQARAYLAQSDEADIATLAAQVLEFESPAPLACLTHNDLSPANLVRTDDGIVVLDWEYARLGDPAFDTAALVETHDLTAVEVDALADTLGEPVADRLPAIRLLYLLIETLWWHLRDPAHDRGMLTRLRLEQRLEAR